MDDFENMDTTPTRSTSKRNAKTPSRTPSRRAISAEPESGRRSVHTPLDRTPSRELLNSIRRGTSASGGRRNNAPTPHAKAARRALDQRRTAMFTPGKNRRRSLMEQRETPMGILRNLGKALAPSSKPIVTSSSPQDKSSIAPLKEEGEDMYDDDDDLPIDRPRLSLPIDQDDTDDDLRPPRLSGLEDENYTIQSVELPRRAYSEQPSRLSRGSFGSVGVSDFFNNNEITDYIGQQSDFFPGLLEDLQARGGADDSLLERIDADLTRRMTMGRESDFNFEVPAGVGDQTTFLMSEPGADLAPTSPVVEHSVAEAIAADAQQPVGDVTAGDYGFDDGGVDDYSDLDEVDVEATGFETTRAKAASKARKKQKRISRHGIEYPSLPPSFVKRVAQTALQSSGLGNSRITADTLTALTQASEWFFEQLGDDLGAYADHAKRKTIEESDVVTLMKRQRQVGSNTTLFSLAQKHLPRELLQELRMPVPKPVKQRRAKRAREDDSEDVTEFT
ncbi:Fc.00g035960.m01.CDS01 [Cosmosporella sp. VM-42]